MAGRWRGAAVAIWLGLAAGAAAADSLRADDPEALVQALRGQGFQAELSRTRAGDPLIRAATPEALPFQVRFFGCLRGEGCTSVQLVARFGARGVSAETVNGWNATLRHGRLHVTPGGQPVLAQDLALAPEGLSPAQFAARLEIWALLMEGVLARLAE